MPETTGGNDGGAGAARAARIGSARADFIASLGRRVGELRTIVNGLEQDPGSPRLRDDLRRRVHALSAGARLLRFAGMATALAEVERTLERAASVGGLAKAELRDMAQILESMPSFAYNEPADEARRTERPPATALIGETAVVPPTVLVIGPAGLADAITQGVDRAGENEMECERADTASAGLELARALAPDVAVVDIDMPGAKDLVEKLGKDTQTEPTPLIVVGTWATPEEGAKWVAAGAAMALAKPVSPHDLRKACSDVSSGVAEPAHHGPLGRTTVEELTTLLIGEIKRGLPDALVQGRSTPIQLGDGSDILAAVWGAVARVRDLVMIKSGGAVRFSNLGPEGALPIAPWWGDSHTSGARPLDPKREAETRLEGRSVVVADDDPAVTWFIGGLLRAAGAEVREAHDGDRALELCFRLGPDLVISDVLMPGMDGFALCRALKRDIALRDVPVILLSWKEDLLQRLRDLGADADGYLRKEASAAAILQRVHEVLRTRLRIEARLKRDGEVRGRLDGVTPATLLRTIQKVRPDARLCIRDASFLYEVEIRNGAPRSATRTTSDGAFQRGKDVFAAFLGVRTGRYVVSRAQGSARGTLEGDLAWQMEEPLAHARAALRLLGGTRLLEVHRVSIALERVIAYLGATPEPARSLVNRLAKGASPRELIVGGEIAPAHLEEVLCDLAARGAVVGVEGAAGVDLLSPAIEQELAALRRGNVPSHPPRWVAKRNTSERELTTPKAGSVAPERAKPTDETKPGPAATTLPSPSDKTPGAGQNPDTAPAGVTLGRVKIASVVAAPEPKRAPSVTESSPNIEAAELTYSWTEGGSEEKTPSSLEAALIREVSDRTPAPAPVAAAPGAGSIVDTSELRARIPGTPTLRGELPTAIPSLPPDAIVPGSASDEKIKTLSDEKIKTLELAATAVFVSGGSSDHRLEAAVVPGNSSDRLEAAPGLTTSDARMPNAEPRIQTSQLAKTVEGTSPRTEVEPAAQRAPRVEWPTQPTKREAPTPVDSRPDAAARPTQSRAFLIALLVALAMFGALIFLLQSEGEKPADSRGGVVSPGAPSASAAPGVAPSEPERAAPVQSASAPDNAAEADKGAPAASSSSGLTQTSGEDLPLPAGAVVTPGQGLLDIETGAREAIFVDGVELGRGPFLRLTLSPGVHEVRLRAHGEERIRFVLIRSTRRTRLPLSSAWGH